MTAPADFEQVTDQLHKDMTHLANAYRKRGRPTDAEVAESLEWCADQLAAIKEARNG